jgi:hypothetical protein
MTSSCRIFMCSTCVWSMLFFSSSNYVIISTSFSWRGSIWACDSCFCICAVCNSTCNFLISSIPFSCSMMLIVFCLCLRSRIVVLILYTSWSHYWTCSSSSSVVHICTTLSNNYAVVLTHFSISASWSATFVFLFSQTSGGVMGLSFPFSSSISCLYWSIVCVMRLIFFFALLSTAYVLFNIQLYVSFNPCIDCLCVPFIPWFRD